jgi:hypothetical protein
MYHQPFPEKTTGKVRERKKNIGKRLSAARKRVEKKGKLLGF